MEKFYFFNFFFLSKGDPNPQTAIQYVKARFKKSKGNPKCPSASQNKQTKMLDKLLKRKLNQLNTSQIGETQAKRVDCKLKRWIVS